MILALLLVMGCDVDFTGLERIDTFAEEAATSLQVTEVICPGADTLAVGDVGSCEARNASGTRLFAGDFDLIIWESSDPSVIVVNVDGGYEAVAVGSADVLARGTDGSFASDTVTVQ